MVVFDLVLHIVELRIMPSPRECRETRNILTGVVTLIPRLEKPVEDVLHLLFGWPQQLLIVRSLTMLVEVIAPKDDTTVAFLRVDVVARFKRRI